MATRPTGPGTSRYAGPLADEGVALGQRVAGERFEQPAQRHVLAERHAVDLVVALDDLAVRVDAARRRCGTRPGPRPRPCPTIIGASRSTARLPTTSAHGSSTKSSSVSMTSSGHTTRSTGGSTRSVASTCALEHLDHARVGLAGALLAAALHEGDLGRADGVALRGATEPPSSERATRASEPDRRPPGPPHRGGGGLARPARSPAPAAGCRPTRSTGASGPATWPMARLARGTPPKGHVHRSSSASVQVPASASHRPRPGGAAATPAPSMPA